nr:MAG TPA: hypothetical protein [Caudoviricetes sp.]
MLETSDKSLVIDCYLAPRDMRTATYITNASIARKIRYGYFQTSNFELSEDTLSITTSKIYTYTDLSDYQKGDFIACYLPNPTVEEFGIFGYTSKVPYFVGVIDSVEIVNTIGKPNILNLKEVISVFDSDILVTKGSGSSWANHVRTVAANNFYTYDRYVDLLGGATGSPSMSASWNHAHQLAGISLHRGNSTDWRYDPTEPYTSISFYKYIVNGTKKYNQFLRVRGIQWNLPEYAADGKTRIYPQSDDAFGLEQFNLVDIDLVKTDDSDAASFHIKDNTDDLFDWEFTTSVGSTEANAVRVLRLDADGNSKAITTVKDGQNVVTIQPLHTAENRAYPYSGLGTPAQVPSGILNNNIDGLYYFITTRGEVIGNGIQMEDKNGNNKRWASAADGYAGSLLFDVPDDVSDKIGTSQADNPFWYHRFDKYVQLPIKMKQIVVKTEDLGAKDPVGGDRPSYLSQARNELSAAAYAHQFKIKVKMDSELIDWRELWLGRSVYVTYKGVQYKSLVTARQLKSGTNYITIILGHNRHKLGALLQEKLT